MPEVIQQVYRQYLQEGWPGVNARPNVPCKYMSLQVSVPSGGRKPRPGDAVYYNRTLNRVAVPNSDAQERQVIGVVSYDVGTVGSTLDSPPTGANSDAFLEFDDGAFALIATFGVFYATAGEALRYGDVVKYDRTDHMWNRDANPTTIAALGTSGDLTAIPDNVADAATLADVRTYTQALGTALAAWKTAIEAYGDNVTAFPSRIPTVTIKCDNEEGVASGGLVKLNIGVGA